MTNVPSIVSRRLARQVALSALLAGMLVLAGCSSTGGAGSASGGQSGSSPGRASSTGSASAGVISLIRDISLHEDRASESAAGTLDSTSTLKPSHVSSPNYASQGRTLSMVGNAVLSSLSGDNTDDRAPVPDGQEITVRLDGGGTRVVVQPNDQALKVNQRVKIITSSGPTRVLPD